MADTRAVLAERKLEHFIRYGWHVIEPTTPYRSNWHIGAICEHLEAVTARQIKRLIINMPPRSMKSISTSVMWPAWAWIRQPGERFMYASYSASLSQDHSVARRTVIRSPWYRENWGDRFGMSEDQDEKKEFVNDHRGVMIATSTGGRATGKGGGILVADDLMNPEQAASDAERLAANRFFDQSFYGRLNDPNTDAIVIVMQRLHEDDTTGHALASGEWDLLVLPMEYDGRRSVTSLGWRDPRTEIGDLLWPDRFSRTTVEDTKRRLGAYAYSGQHQQRPSPAEGGTIKRHWWQYWQPANQDLPPVMVKMPDGQVQPVTARKLPLALDEVIDSWDCAFKALDTSDFVSGGKWGRVGAGKFLLERDCRRMDFPATIEAITAMSARKPVAGAKYVEDKANGPAVIQVLRHSIPGLIAVNPSGGKIARAAAVSPQIQAGNVYLPHPQIAPWVEQFIEQCAAFPNGAHDDDVDMTTQALLKLGAVDHSKVFPDFARATHIERYPLKSWWHRWLAIHWDPEESCILWWCSDERKRVHVYREFVGRGLSAQELGGEAARLSADDLEGIQHMHAWTLGEYFEARNSAARSVAQQIGEGISAVLGDSTAFLWAFNADERMMDREQAYYSLNARRKRAQATQMTIQHAQGTAAAAWEHLRSLMRTAPLAPRPDVTYNRELARQLVESGEMAKYAEYMDRVEGKESEPFPKIFVSPACVSTADAIFSAARDEKHPEELAPGAYPGLLSALMLGSLAHKEIQNRQPESEYVQGRLDRLRPDADPMARHMAAKKAEADFRKKEMAPIRFQRGRRGR